MGRPKKSPPAPRPLMDVLDEVSPSIVQEAINTDLAVTVSSIAFQKDPLPATAEDLVELKTWVIQTIAERDCKATPDYDRIALLEQRVDALATLFSNLSGDTAQSLLRLETTVAARLEAVQGQINGVPLSRPDEQPYNDSIITDQATTRYNALEAKLDALNATIGAY